jgi:hypothetical protein
LPGSQGPGFLVLLEMLSFWNFTPWSSFWSWASLSCIYFFSVLYTKIRLDQLSCVFAAIVGWVEIREPVVVNSIPGSKPNTRISIGYHLTLILYIGPIFFLIILD